MAGIIINEDFENFMASRPMDKMTEAGLKEQIDNYARQQVEMIVFCGNGMRAMFDSHVFEPLWKDMEELPDGRTVVRFATSWATTQDAVEQLLAVLEEI